MKTHTHMRTMGIFQQFLERHIWTKEGWIRKQEIRKNRKKYGKMVGVTQSEPEVSDIGQKPMVRPIDWIPTYNGAEGHDCKSISGYVFMMSGGVIAWSTKKQGTIALSTLKAKYAAISNATRHILWHRMCNDQLPSIVWETWLGLSLQAGPSITRSGTKKEID